MSQLKDIKERIESVKKTRKMTQAMKMVAAAKFKRFSNQAVSSRTILTELDLNLNQLTVELGGPADSEYARPVDSNKEFTNRSWFWKNLKKNAKFFTIEVYNVNYKSYLNLINILKSKLRRNEKFKKF